MTMGRREHPGNQVPERRSLIRDLGIYTIETLAFFEIPDSRKRLPG